MSITRDNYREIVLNACQLAGVSEADTERLVATSEDASQVLVGSFSGTIQGVECGCPATLAGFFNPDTGHFNYGTSSQVRKFPNFFDPHFTSSPDLAEIYSDRILVDNALDAEQPMVVKITDA